MFKKGWAGLFFGSGAAPSISATSLPTGAGVVPPSTAPGTDPSCGRFAEDLCQAYLSIATTGKADDAQRRIV